MRNTPQQLEKEKPVFNLENEETVIKILNDSIIFYRIAASFSGALRAFTPTEQHDNFTPSFNYLGFDTALDLLGLEDLEKYGRLRESLQEIGWEYCETNKVADTLARELYFKWIYEAQEQ